MTRWLKLVAGLLIGVIAWRGAGLAQAAEAGRTFFVSTTAGNDRHDGVSPQSPWRSLERVNAADLKAGDRVLLRRGKAWRGTLVPRTAPRMPTMADLFSACGYQCGQFGKWHLGDNYPYRPQDRGFHEAIYYPSSHIGSAPDFWNNHYFNDTYWHNGRREEFRGHTTDVFFGEAIKWMRTQAERKKPFFCYPLPPGDAENRRLRPAVGPTIYPCIAPLVSRVRAVILVVSSKRKARG